MRKIIYYIKIAGKHNTNTQHTHTYTTRAYNKKMQLSSFTTGLVIQNDP